MQLLREQCLVVLINSVVKLSLLMRNDTKELAVQSCDDLCGSFAFLTTV